MPSTGNTRKRTFFAEEREGVVQLRTKRGPRSSDADETKEDAWLLPGRLKELVEAVLDGVRRPVFEAGQGIVRGRQQRRNFSWREFFELFVAGDEFGVWRWFLEEVAGEAWQVLEGLEAVLGECEDLLFVAIRSFFGTFGPEEFDAVG